MSETGDRKEDREPIASDPGDPSGERDDEREGADERDERDKKHPKEESVEQGLEAEGDVELDEVDVRDLLRAALTPPNPAPKEEAKMLRGVQRRLRVRSQGKFYADGWSTSKSPRSTYLVTSIFMLVLIAFVFLVLVPWGNGALP